MSDTTTTIAPTIVAPIVELPHWAQSLTDEQKAKLLGVSRLRTNCLESKVNDKEWKPRNASINRAHLQYAAANSLHMGLLTWGDAATQYPCLKDGARLAVFASGMSEVLLNDRNSISKLLSWIANDGKHVEVVKKSKKKADEVESATDGAGI